MARSLYPEDAKTHARWMTETGEFGPARSSGMPPSAWVMRFLPLVRRRGSVLDVAAGEGRHTALMLMRGLRVTAVDIDVSALEGLVGTPGFTLECRDLEAEPWPYAPASFDALVVVNYLHRAHLPRYWEALAPGGILIFEAFLQTNARIWGRPRSPDHALRDGELLGLIPPGARLIAYEEGATDTELLVARMACAKPSGADPYGYALGAR